jgi:hypothetical protein
MSADLSARLARLYTGAVADILDDLGYRRQCLPAEIRPLEPRMKLAGPAFTVRGRAMPPGQRRPAPAADGHARRHLPGQRDRDRPGR